MKSTLTAFRQIFDFSNCSPYLLISLVVTSLLATFAEGLGVSLILPLLDDSPLEVNAFDKIPYLKSLSQFVGDLELKRRVQLAAIVLTFIVLIRSVFSYISQVLAIYLQVNVESGLQKQIFRQILAVQISFIHRERQGNLLETLTRHARQSGGLVLGLANGLIHCFTVIVYVGLALLISWQLTLIAMILFLALVRLNHQLFSLRINRLSKKLRSLGLQLMSTMTEELSALKLTHLFSRETHSLDRFSKVHGKYYNYQIKANKLVTLVRPAFNFLSTLALGVLLFSSTFLLEDQPEGRLGEITLFLFIVFRLMAPVSSLNQVKAQMDRLSPYLQSVVDFLQQKDKPILKNGSIHFESLKTGIQFSDITFSYNPDKDNILKNVTFEIPKGKMTAFVGPSGAGKSTLVHLITRLSDPESGRILVDGTELRNFDITSWRSQLAVVSQDDFLFNDTVQANLKFAKPTATDEEIFNAAQLAQAHDFIMELPQGYDTLLGDRGVRLSGGQQQRIAMARAILVGPQLLILDEATSDLDSKTERAFQNAIEQYYDGHTLLVIAHRLSTIRRADTIIVLDAGAVVEQGTHKELMLKQDYYYQLVQAQNLGHETLVSIS